MKEKQEEDMKATKKDINERKKDRLKLMKNKINYLKKVRKRTN